MIAGNLASLSGPFRQRTVAFLAEGIFSGYGRVKGKGRWGFNSVRCGAQRSGPAAEGDLALVAAVLQKDRKATAEFVNTYTDAVYSFIRRRFGRLR